MPAIGERLHVIDGVQGVDLWMVEIAIDTGSGYGAYSELTEIDPETSLPYSDVGNEIYYECPSVPAGSGDDEHRDYSFSFGYTVPETLSIGDKFKFRFTPAGWDEENGDPFESGEYEVTEILSNYTYHSQLSLSISL